ncbi:MAG: hypothetical protein QOJ15_2542, partial [Bradyrhizobium sp.]|nr:hypothetical protein [Bradyrhizobium sp.]
MSHSLHAPRRQFQATSGLIDELEAAVASKDLRRQSQMMRRVTDLFTTSHGLAKPEQAALLDDVMSRLVSVVDASVRAELGNRLATLPNAPGRTLHLLALDDAIEVAGPILEKSEDLRETTLIESARTKGQSHLLAISRRDTIPVSITDILVERGNQDVILSATRNAGAQFSDASAAMLSTRASDDADLACQLWSRSDIPRQHLLAMFERASRQVAAKLIALDGTKAEMFRQLVAEASNRARAAVREGSWRHAAALALVEDLVHRGQLDEARIRSFAESKSFDEVLVALSLKCDLPLETVELVLSGPRIDQLLVLAKAAGLGWETTRPVLIMAGSTDINAQREV